ncbi:MAG: alpha-galactosidase [Ruminococcaceae bacterium]|nr:alpha-galactosidase [Oscillospiraceae bacterium]
MRKDTVRTKKFFDLRKGFILLGTFFLLTSCTNIANTPDQLRIETNYWPEYQNFDEYTVMRDTLEKWFVDTYIQGEGVPFSFSYDGMSTLKEDILSSWQRSVENSEDDHGKYYTIRYTNPSDGLSVWSEFILYKDYPTLEFCTYAENTGKETSKTISNFMGMNMKFALGSENITLHTTIGSQDLGGDDADDFSLVAKELKKTPVIYFPEYQDGRSTEKAWPYFDLIGEDSGLMVAIGWTGIWKASFAAEDGIASMQGGQFSLSASLYAGEKIRTPLYSITYFEGDAEYGHNLFRKTVLKHYTPNDGTADVCRLPVAVTTESYGEEEIIADVSKWLGKLSLDTVWTDAAWFGNIDTDPNGWVTQVGNWWVNTNRYPSGSLQKVSDFLHDNDKKYVVWFELERVAPGTQLYNEHPELLYDCDAAGSRILKLSDEAAYQWVFGYLSDMIRNNGIDIYRIDMNCPCIAAAWRSNDSEDREGITEIRYIENLYRLYDSLLVEFPGLMIDNCASGGKRLDLEMIRRTVALHRSDYTCVPYGYEENQWNWEGIQYHTQALSYWLPIHSTSVGYPVRVFENPYYVRSLLAAGSSIGIQIGYAADDSNAQKLSAELSDLRGLFLGEYYGLMEPDHNYDTRQAYMYYRDDIDEALVLVYTRQSYAGESSFSLPLKGLNPSTGYCIVDMDSEDTSVQVIKGKKLMEEGLPVTSDPYTAKVYVLTPLDK